MKKTALLASLVASLLFAVHAYPDLACIDDDLNSWKIHDGRAQLIDGKYAATSYHIEPSVNRKIQKLIDSDRYEIDQIIRMKQQYSPLKAIDKNKNTCWCEGKSDDGIGEGVLYEVKPSIKTISILPGVALGKWFKKNNRPRKVLIELYIAEPDCGTIGQCDPWWHLTPQWRETVTLKDSMTYQRIPVKVDSIMRDMLKKKTATCGNNKLVIGISLKSVYRGTQFRDTCISEIKFH